MNSRSVLKLSLDALGSLRLSVILLGLSVLLVFFGTLDQVRIGIREAQDIYFESFFAIWRYPVIWPGGDFLNYIPLPLPGGYLIGPLLLVNLVTGHLRYWRPRWAIIGISFIHLGIIMLLIGQLATNLSQTEDYMWLDEGGKSNYVESFLLDEFYVSKIGEDGALGVYSLPFDSLEAESTLDDLPFPVEVKLHEVFDNAEIVQGGQAQGRKTFGVNQGLALQMNLGVREIESFYSDSQRDIRTAIVEVMNGDQSVGTWMVSNVFEPRFPRQEFVVDGQRYAIGMRYKRTYLPYTLTLLEFIHERYPGTDIPSNFASRVLLENPEKGESKEVMIFMNNPLRYDGMTFYQASFAKQDTASMFQVVQNPSWLIPYVACILVSIGLTYQFGVAGFRMLRRVK
jgi:hypothetical protein